MSRIGGRTPFALVLAGVFAFVPPARCAESVDPAALDGIMEEALKAWNVPGVALVVVRDDKVIHMKGYGVKRLGENNPVTPDTLFQIGSTTKAFTTTAMAMLVDEKKMDWDDPVRKHIDYFQLSDPLASENCTLRDLVSHRTGLKDHLLLEFGATWGTEETIRRLGRVKLSHSFRSRFDYSNVPFTVAGYAVGLASKSNYNEFVRTRIFEPLGMKTANFRLEDMRKSPDHASPHNVGKDDKAEVMPWISIENAGGAGAINGSVRDLAPWLRFQLGSGSFEGKRLVSGANLEETHTPQMVIRSETLWKLLLPDTQQLSYGLGWMIYDYRGHPVVAHGGGTFGYTCHIVLLPKANTAFAVLTNAQAAMSSVVPNTLCDYLLGLEKKDWNKSVKSALFLSKIGQALTEAKPKSGTKPSRELKAYEGDYEDAAYGKATIEEKDDTLFLRWSSFAFKLEHFHYDTFALKSEDRAKTWDLFDKEKAVFALGADGEVERMTFLEQGFRKVKKAAK
jgi:CubicO group peptidase (beta-lactamase class C family)